MSEPPDEFLKRYDAALLTLRYWGSMSLICTPVHLRLF